MSMLETCFKILFEGVLRISICFRPSNSYRQSYTSLVYTHSKGQKGVKRTLKLGSDLGRVP